MDSDKYEVINCPEEDENRVYCHISDKLCIKRFFKKSTDITNPHK